MKKQTKKELSIFIMLIIIITTGLFTMYGCTKFLEKYIENERWSEFCGQAENEARADCYNWFQKQKEDKNFFRYFKH